MGNIVARNVRCDAKGKVMAGFAAAGLLKIGPEGEIPPDKGRVTVPVAGRNGRAITIHEINVGCAAVGSKFFQIDIYLCGIGGIGKGGKVEDAVIRSQRDRQIFVFLDRALKVGAI